MTIIHNILKITFKTLNNISPVVAGNIAFKIFQRTNRKTIKPKEKQFIENSHRFILNTEFGTINCYENGSTDHPSVLLVHGWNSSAGSMSMISKRLIERGYHTIALDLPSHGNNKGSYTNLLECKEVVKTLINRIRTEKPISIVSHSFGSLVTAYALSETRKNINQLVFLTSPDRSSHIFDFFKNTVGLADKAYDHMTSLASNLLKEPLENVNVADKLPLSKFKDLTLIHDKMDKVLPYQNSKAINDRINGSELISFEKIGHYRMLWNEKVLDEIMRKF